MAAAMLASLAVVLVLGVWIPSPLNRLLHAAASVIGGTGVITTQERTVDADAACARAPAASAGG